MVVPVTPSYLAQPTFTDAFDASQVVFVLPADSLDSAEALARCKQLRAQGYHTGLQIASTDILRKIPVASFDCLQINAAVARQELSAIDLIYAKDAGFRKIAAAVGSHEMFGWLSDRGFDWYDSHFLTAKNPLTHKEPDLARLKLLLSLIHI